MDTLDLQKLLSTRGVTPTAQRLEIASVLLSRPQHLSADQILERLRVQGSSVSKATVYNTLKLFSECGLASEVNVDTTRVFYDSTTHQHHHFYNADTGELIDIPAGQVQFPQLPDAPEGMERERVELLIRVRDKR